MRTIAAIVFLSADEKHVEITFDDNAVAVVPYPVTGQYAAHVDSWLTSNAIAVYSPWANMTLEQAQSKQLLEIKKQFTAESIQPVAVAGVSYNGGVNSAMLLNGKADTLIHLAVASGDIHDINNAPHALSTTQIKDVAAAISVAYELVFDKYQLKKTQIANCTDIACVSSITW